MSLSKGTEIEWLKTAIIPKLLKQQKLIEDFRNNDFENFEILDCHIALMGLEEGFMLTNCYKARIEYKFKGAVNKINFFIKKTPELSQEIFDSINFKALFTNEILAYEKLMPALQKFSEIDLKLAKFYYAELTNNFATVITEDFVSQQWITTKQVVNISLNHILLGVKYLAEFHAAGFAWRQKEPQKFHEFTKELKEARYDSDLHPNWALTLRESKKRALSATRKYEASVDEEFLEKLNNLLGDSYHYGKERLKPREPFITLCHGDFLRNNVAYKYDKNDQPVDIMMFDLQTLRISSPMVDLSIFLSLSTYAEVRYKHFTEIFALYTTTLQNTYRGLVSGKMPTYLSYNSLLREYIKFLPYSISICAAFLMILVEPKRETSQELLMAQPTEEEMIRQVMSRGGEEVDRELAHQIKELYELNIANDVNVFEEF